MKLTVFTPLYNRKDQIEKLYRSLQKQRAFDFEWLIVDDGSTDAPEDLIKEWMKEENPFEIVFFQQENGGKHRAMNRAVQNARGDYFFTCDSDDYLTDDAIALILCWLEEIHGISSLSGVAGMKAAEDGRFLLWREKEDGSLDTYGGVPDFEGYIDATCEDSFRYGLFGDRCEVVRTDIMKEYLFPEYEGEGFMTESVMWNRMSRDGIVLRWYDKAVEICEYQEEGLTNQGLKKFIDSPKGYGLYLRENICSEKVRRELFFDYYDQLNEVLSEQEIAENLGVADLADIKCVGRERMESRLRELSLMEEVVNTKRNLRNSGEALYEQMKPQLMGLLETAVKNKKECEIVLEGNEADVLRAIAEERERLKEI